MDFDFTDQENKFREGLHNWLDANAPALLADGPQYTDPAKRWDRAARWHRALFEAGWVGIYWPKQYGGRGATLIEQYIYDEEVDRIGAPGTINPVGLNIAGPTIMQWGTDEQKDRYLRPILSGDEIWCQGYSEPGAGSDLASLTTRAEDRGDYFVVNGQKVWTTLAHRSHFCLLLCRTDPAAPKHKGLSYMLVDMKTPGITVRPLVQMTGNHDFNEVFFEDVVVPKHNLLGPQNDGWRVGVTTLMFERLTVGALLQIEREASKLAKLLTAPDSSGRAPADNPHVRQRFVQIETECRAARYSSLRSLTRRLKGQAARAGRLDRQTVSHRVADKNDEFRRRGTWTVRADHGRFCARGRTRALDAFLLLCARADHRGRNLRDSTQYNRRARSGLAEGIAA